MKLLKPITVFITALLSTGAAQATQNNLPVVQEEQADQSATELNTASLQPRFTMVYVERTTYQRLRDFFLTKEKVAQVYTKRAGKIISGIASNEIYFLSEVQKARFAKEFEAEYGVNFEQFNEVQMTRKEVDFKLSEIKERKFKIV